MYWCKLKLCGYGASEEFRLQIYGGAEGIRTPDLLRAREALSQLSYSPFYTAAAVLAVNPQLKMVGDRGLEPLTFCV